MNRPTDKQIEEVLAGVATPEDAKFVAEWFATEEGNTYLDAVMTREAEHLKAETAEIYVDHTIPSEKMYHQIQKNISRKQIKRTCFRVAAILIPVIFLIGLYLQINSRVDLFGTGHFLYYISVSRPAVTGILLQRRESDLHVLHPDRSQYLYFPDRLVHRKKYPIHERKVRSD